MKARQLPYIALAALVLIAAACKTNSDATASTTGAAAPSEKGGAKSGVLAIEANEKGFTPSSVELKKGQAATLVFKRTTDETCAKEVVFPELKLTRELPLNVPVSIDVPVGETRTLTFQCGMGMFKGKIVIS